jgi:hypothetical protein
MQGPVREFSLGGLPSMMEMATAAGSYRTNGGQGEKELEQRNTMMWRGREEIGSNDSGVHYCCLELAAMASSTQRGNSMGCASLLWWVRGVERGEK